MVAENVDSLQVHFRRSIPVGFIDQLIRRQEWVYHEARQQCFQNTVWGDPEARWMLGFTERAIFESEMRKAAITHGLTFENLVHTGSNCNYVKVAAGNLRITGHHVASPGSFVDPCVSRKQDAAVNGFMDEYIDDGLLCVPLPKIQQAAEIAIYFLHGATDGQDGKRTLFFEVAAPDSELPEYRWRSSMLNVRQSYLADARKQKPAATVEDKAKPKPKPFKEKRPEAENE